MTVDFRTQRVENYYCSCLNRVIEMYMDIDLQLQAIDFMTSESVFKITPLVVVKVPGNSNPASVQ